MIKVAMLSKWHVHANGYANTVKNSGKAEITVVWDEDAERGAAWAKELGCDFEPCLDKLLARDDVDAVVCDAPTTAHKDVLVKSAKAGKHIFTEKALCPTVAECLEVKAAVEEAGVKFCISHPQKGRPSVRFARQMIDEGALGTLTYVRVRDAHSGISDKWLPAYWFEKKDAAGGAMMDLGCHPMYLIAYFLGEPKRISGMFTNSLCGTPVDENAVAVAEFDNGAIGVAETSLVSPGAPQMIEIYGTEGVILVTGEDVLFKSRVKYPDLFGGFIKPSLPHGLPHPLVQFIDALAEDKEIPEHLGMDDAIMLTKLLENSYISEETGTIVKF